MLSLRRLAVVLLCLVLVLSTRAGAQSTADALNARLLGKVLFLRSLCFQKRLSFDERGELGNTCDPVPFTVGLVQIDKVDVNTAGIDLQAHRLGLEFKDSQIQRFPLAGALPLGASPKIGIHIAPAASGDYGSALDRVFATNFKEIYANVPEFWHAYFLRHLVPEGWQPADFVPDAPVDVAGKNGTTIPRVIRQVDAKYSDYAKAAQFSGPYS